MMNATKNSLRRPTRLTALTLALTLSLGIIVGDPARFMTTARAALTTKEKVGADIRRQLAQKSGDEPVDVIIQPALSWNVALDADLRARGAAVKPAYQSFKARAVRMRLRDVEAAALRPDVAYVSLDREVLPLGHVTLTSGADDAAAMGGATRYDGTGASIVVMDSGVNASHVFQNDASNKSRVVYSQDFTGEGRTDDPYGHGTHVASIAAGNGTVASGAYQGVAPNARLINLRVLDSRGRGRVSSLLAALDWVYVNRANAAYNIRVVNLSLGTTAVDSYTKDPACLAVRKLADAGIVVVAAAGNEGKDASGNKIYGQIHSPGNDPSVITVGAANTFGTDTRLDDGVTSYSSRGPTRSFWTDTAGTKHYDNLIKPDLVAPGNKLIAAQSAGNYLVATTPSLDADVSNAVVKDQMYLSGSSMATPVVAGAAALLKQASPTLTPNLVKMILMYTAQPLAGFNQFEQGAGLVNLEGAMRLARLVRTDLSASTPVGAPLLCSTCAEPTPLSTVAGQQFYWGRGIILDHTFATGANLILKYQAVYGLGVILADATPWVQGNGVVLSDGVILSDGITFSESILTSNGTTLDAGSILCGTGVLLGDGVLLSDGVILADGGKVVGDGVLLSDGVTLGDVYTQAVLVLATGDDTRAMGVTLDGTPTALKATVVSKSQINLTWVDNATNESGYRVERSLDGVSFSTVATLAAGAVSYANTGLVANTKYHYRVYAFNNRGTTRYSATVSALTPRK